MLPSFCSAFHIGSRYKPSHAEGVNSTIFIGIVGDLLINLARFIDILPPAGVHIGDFNAILPDVDTQVSHTEFLRYIPHEI